VTPHKIIAVIPALNEEKTISRVLRGVKAQVDEIVLVDDASTDNTAIIAEKEDAILLRQWKNVGYDRSINEGFDLANKRGATVILTFDADGQHDPRDIPRILEPILSDKADVVVGKRPYHTRITEHLFSIISRLKANIEDPLCGLKAYHIKVYQEIGYFDKISSIGTQLMFNAKKKGYRIFQVDISLKKREGDPRFGRKLKANWSILKAIMKTLILYGFKNLKKEKSNIKN
jgi:glycosyltransferase involved in cell wall biosynthesis